MVNRENYFTVFRGRFQLLLLELDSRLLCSPLKGGKEERKKKEKKKKKKKKKLEELLRWGNPFDTRCRRIVMKLAPCPRELFTSRFQGN